MARSFFLVCYDIAEPKRLRRVRRYLQGFRVAGQKSVFECWMTEAEYNQAIEVLSELMDHGEDKLHFFQLDPRQLVHCFGMAQHFTEQAFIIG